MWRYSRGHCEPTKIVFIHPQVRIISWGSTVPIKSNLDRFQEFILGVERLSISPPGLSCFRNSFTLVYLRSLMISIFILFVRLITFLNNGLKNWEILIVPSQSSHFLSLLLACDSLSWLYRFETWIPNVIFDTRAWTLWPKRNKIAPSDTALFL